MDAPLIQLGTRVYSVSDGLIAGAVLVALVLLFILIALWRSASRSAALEAAARERARELEAQVSAIVQSQGEMNGRMATIAEVFGSRQTELVTGLTDRLDKMSQRVGESLTDTTRKTQESLGKVHERLAVIDNAQANLQTLSGQVVQLQQILSNKQTRGAFGQGRMEAILKDGLPSNAFSLQPTLSNGKRPDCLIHMPNDAPPLVVDAKFPLEGWTAVREARSPEASKAGQQRFRTDIQRHIDDIHEKYLIAGETQDMAFMFVPSESVFAGIHEQFDDLIQKAHRARVVIVSPALLMLSIQVIQAVLKDVRMREQAHVIQTEVGRLTNDVRLLDERVRKLHGHFGQTAKDVDNILISSDKITRRAGRIEALDFDEDAKAAARDPQLMAGE